MKHIAVEKGLGNISDYLSDYGYEIYEIDAAQKDNKDFIVGFDAVVLTGLNTNFIGVQDTYGNAPIIEAKGLSPKDVKDAIERSIKAQ